MDELDKNKTENNGTQINNGEPSEEKSGTRWEQVGETTRKEKPKVIEDFIEDGVKRVVHISKDVKMNATETRKEVTEEGYEVDFGDTVTLKNDGTVYNGKGEKIDFSVDNGFEGKTFAAVKGIEEKTIYEKVIEEAKDKFRTVILPLVLVVGLGVPLIALFKSCGGDKIEGPGDYSETVSETSDYSDSPAPDDTPSYETDPFYEDDTSYEEKDPAPEIPDVTEEEIQQALQSIYYDSYQEIADIVDIATIVRGAQDGAMGVDYDMELLGSDLCTYDEIYKSIVAPGSDDVRTQEEFKAKYGNGPQTIEEYQAMLDEGIPILDAYGNWLVKHIQINGQHIETTQAVIDAGLRSETYEDEKAILEGFDQESRAKLDDYYSAKEALEINKAMIQGVQDGTLSFQVQPDGSTVFYNQDGTMMYHYAASPASAYQNDGGIGGK